MYESQYAASENGAGERQECVSCVTTGEECDPSARDRGRTLRTDSEQRTGRDSAVMELSGTQGGGSQGEGAKNKIPK